MTMVQPRLRPIAFLVVRTSTLLAVALVLILVLLPAVIAAAGATLAVSGN